MNTFVVHILSADAPCYEGPCESLIVPTSQGKYGILKNHCNMIAAVVPGSLSYKVPGREEEILSVSEGMVKIENNDVMVLVDVLETLDEIDVNRARREADEAKEMMLQKRSRREYRIAQATLARAANRLRVKQHYDKEFMV
ncbi:MAG: ATP synthase F1 subunit epsilon [Lachnospiraceae bacterium]|nr:ATP synthase F1 subunit epsilon [Lachnospiraceae bacterium]